MLSTTFFKPLPRLQTGKPSPVTGRDTISALVTLPGSKTYHALNYVSRFRARYSGGKCACCSHTILKDQPVVYDSFHKVITHMWCFNHAQNTITPALIATYTNSDTEN